MTKYIVYCNMCGKEFDMYDEAQNFSIDHVYGYGSVHDDNRLQIDLCCECLDVLTTYLIENCKISPIPKYEED